MGTGKFMTRSIQWIAFFVLIVLISGNNAFADYQIQNSGIWPGFDNAGAVAVDPYRNIVFSGAGDIIGVYDYDMKYLSHLRIPTKSGISGIDYDPDSKPLIASTAY
jgi:hypothetical protein